MAALPEDLREVLKPMTKYTDKKGNSSNTIANIGASVDYLPLLAEFEVFGSSYGYANMNEEYHQTQYAYFVNGNSKIKYRYSSTGSTAEWWLRSASKNGSSSFCTVSVASDATTNLAFRSTGLAPIFKV